MTGDLVINVSNLVAIHGDYLTNAATANGCDLKLSGTSPYLNQILATKSSNSHISLKN